MINFSNYIKKAEGKEKAEVNALIKELYALVRKEGSEILLAKAAAATDTWCASGQYEENAEEKALSEKYQALYAEYKAAMAEMEMPFKKEAAPQKRRPVRQTTIEATQVYDDDKAPTSHKIIL